MFLESIGAAYYKLGEMLTDCDPFTQYQGYKASIELSRQIAYVLYESDGVCVTDKINCNDWLKSFEQIWEDKQGFKIGSELGLFVRDVLRTPKSFDMLQDLATHTYGNENWSGIQPTLVFPL